MCLDNSLDCAQITLEVCLTFINSTKNRQNGLKMKKRRVMQIKNFDYKEVFKFFLLVILREMGNK